MQLSFSNFVFYLLVHLKLVVKIAYGHYYLIFQYHCNILFRTAIKKKISMIEFTTNHGMQNAHTWLITELQWTCISHSNECKLVYHGATIPRKSTCLLQLFQWQKEIYDFWFWWSSPWSFKNLLNCMKHETINNCAPIML